MMLTSATEIRRTVFEQLEQDACICVFPTETAVRFWTESYVRRGERGVLRLDRVMAWDRFRAQFLPVLSEQPVNTSIRRLFALSLLTDPEFSHSLQWFRHPAFPDSSANLAGAVGRLLPMLEDLESLRTEQPRSYQRLPKPFRDDIARIHIAYRSFLRDRGLYEPQFLRPSLERRDYDPSVRYCIWFPEVCRGWREFSAMQPFPETIQTFSVEASHVSTQLEWFPNELMELRNRFEMIGRLLDSGTPTRDIVVTVGDLERWLPFLKQEAQLYDIPLSIVQGKSPLRYAPGAFLGAIQDVYAHDFSIPAMKAFLLDPRFPFQNRELQTRLIQRGLEFPRIVGSFTGGEDRWFSVLSRSSKESDRDLLSWYGKMKQQVTAVIRASNGDALRKAIYSCKEFLLGLECWPCSRSGEELHGQVWAYCLDQLQELQRNMELSGFSETPRLFSLYLQLLESKEYVPQGRSPGIAVYQYTVSAGVCCEHHMLLGCTEEVTRQRSESLPLMPESVWDDDRKVDSTIDFLDLYRLGGDHVYCSASQQAFSGTSNIAPGWFVNQGSVVPYEYSPCGPDSQELSAWAELDPLRWRATERHARYFNRAKRSAHVPPRFDFAESSPTMALLNMVQQEDGTLRISSTQLDTFSSCPMKWVAKYLFGLERENYETEQIDHRALGTCMHTIYETFFREAMKVSPVFRKDLGPTYTELLKGIMQIEFERFAHAPTAPTRTTMRHILEKYMTDMLLIIQAEAKHFDEYASVGFEAKRYSVYENLGCTLEGRIDRILCKVDDYGEKTYAVVDYKKSISDRKKDYDPESGSVPSNQLPLYAKLIRDSANAGEVTTAAYYDIGEGRYMVIWGESELVKRDSLMALAEQRVEGMIESLSQGRFGVTSNSRSCIHCDFRQICRRRYALV